MARPLVRAGPRRLSHRRTSPQALLRPQGPAPRVGDTRAHRAARLRLGGGVRAALATALAEREAAERKGKAFLGASRVLAQPPTARPKPGEPRRGLNPRVAARDKWKRIEALGRLIGFLSAYRTAWEARRGGKRTAVFPAGTYLLRVLHGVPCAACG